MIILVILLLHRLVYAQNKECYRTLPGPGVWIDHPPYWIPNDCNLQKDIDIFDEESTQKCMANRTLFTIGNSVGRQMLFGMLEMLGGAYVKREDQRDLCPKHETTWDDSCHEKFANVNLKYLFLQFIDGFNYTDRGGFSFIKNTNLTRLPPDPQAAIDMTNGSAKFWADDNCILQDTRKCLETFFSNSTKDDILIFTVGMPYAADWSSSSIDYENWLRKSAIAFHQNIKDTFKGTVFRFTSSQTRDTKQWKLGFLTQYLKDVDTLLWDLWKSEKEWYEIDQWAINENRDKFYNDHVHFNGPLTFATLHQVLNVMCPGNGISYGNTTLSGKVIHHAQGNTSSFFLTDNEGCLHKMIGNMSCLQMLKSMKPTLVLTMLEIKKTCKGNDFKDICIDKTLVKGSSRSVYMIEGSKRREFQNSNIFISMGFEFDQVLSIDDWTLQQIPEGFPLL